MSIEHPDNAWDALRIGAAVHLFRLDRGLTTAGLARQAGVSKEAVSVIESGDFDGACRESDVEAICAALGKTPKEMLDYFELEVLPSDPLEARKKIESYIAEGDDGGEDGSKRLRSSSGPAPARKSGPLRTVLRTLGALVFH